MTNKLQLFHQKQGYALMILDRKNTKKDTTSTRDNQTLMMKMLTSYSIFLLAILILFFYLYHSAMTNIRSSYNQQAKATMISNVELFEKDLDIMNVYCRQLLQNDNFRKLMAYEKDEGAFFDLGYKLATTLSTDVYPESLLPIDEVYCYLPSTGYVLSPNYFVSGERYYNWFKRYSANGYETWLKALTQKDCYYHFIPMDSIAPNFSKDYYMYIINIEDLFYLEANAVVCFVLDKEELASLFDSLQSSENNSGSLMVYDKENVPILSIGEDISLPASVSLKSASDFADFEQNKTPVTIGTYKSGKTDFTYCYSFPSFELTSSVSTRRILYLTAITFSFLIGVALVVRFSKRNVAPIIELGNELHEAVEAQNQLQEIVENQRPIICKDYVRQLLSGMITSEEELSYIKEYLGLADSGIYYNGLYIVAYNNSSDSIEDTPSSEIMTPEQFHQIVMDALQNYFGMPLYCFRPADRTYGLLLSCLESEEKDFIFKIHEIIVSLHNYLLDTYGIWMFAGIGKNTADLMNVWESYQQATEAASYISKNYFFFPYEFIKKDSSAFYYPQEISTKLIHFITTGNTPQVLELFNLIHQENIEERSLPINILKFLLSDIRNTLLKARFALPSSVPTEKAQQLDERFNQHVTFKLCEDIAMTLCELFTTKTEDTNLITTIEKYIESNYTDPSLGLNKISDEFQISESYFSHMFKEKTGVNFSTYLENIRMHEAARLIRETTISLNELYISVGYNNANTFRRAFKKTYGITPSNMRDGKTS